MTIDNRDEGGRRFRVPIRIPPAWKIKAIAQFKLHQKEKQTTVKSDSGSSNFMSSRRQHNKGASVERTPAVVLINNRYDVPVPDGAKQGLHDLSLKCKEIRNELCAMNNARTSLLWLLRKSTDLEIQRNHSESYIASLRSREQS